MLWRIVEVEINCPYSIRVLEMLSLIVRLLAILDYYTGEESQLCCLGRVTKGDISVVGSNILLILFPSPPLCNTFAQFTPSTLQKSHFTPFLPQKKTTVAPLNAALTPEDIYQSVLSSTQSPLVLNVLYVSAIAQYSFPLMIE